MSAQHPVHLLQSLDCEADASRDERAGLPERASLQANLEDDLGLVRSRAEIEERLEALRQEERAVAAQVADVAARAKGLEDDLYSGRVTSPKELEALQEESASWKAKQGEAEESELELMERGEELEGEIAEIDSRRKQLVDSSQALRAAIAAHEERIDAELARLAEARESVMPGVGDNLLADYEKRRGLERLAGAVMSHLAGNACGVCRVVLPVMEVTRIKAEGPGAYAPCPACKRLILI